MDEGIGRWMDGWKDGRTGRWTDRQRNRVSRWTEEYSEQVGTLTSGRHFADDLATDHVTVDQLFDCGSLIASERRLDTVAGALVRAHRVNLTT